MSDDTLREDDTWHGARSEGPGSVIGPYTLLRRIGEGGFGDVFEAQQDQPVRRRVALKVIKLGMDTREVIARFDAERQALALMQHPHIARVLDAGATESGRPYFVMELVDGEPITDYCDSHRLAVEQRLRLFEQVCAAVQHAHTKGVIHRDLKPGNVLVGTHEGQPFARVIDFGIAKATSGKLTERTLATELNQVVGTPFYMSPEQASGSADIDTRTDVYSLGVILYELLTGSTPVDKTSLRSALFAEIQRMICEVDPPRPSARLAQDPARSSTTASFRATEPRKLERVVRGELDWIVMKAIDKDRARRYETANGLAMDVRRFLAAEPVLAAPPSASYRLQKFVSRNKGAVAASSLIVLSLLAGIAGFAWQARIARARANELEQVSKFQADMLSQVDPTQAGIVLTDDVRSMVKASLAKSALSETERSAQLASFVAQWQRVNATDAASNMIDRTILKPAVLAIDKQFRKQPLVDAKLRQALATLYGGLGLLDAAMPLQRSALATRRRELGDSHRDTLASIAMMGALLEAQGKLEESERYTREALEGQRRVLGELDPETLTSINDLGSVLHARGDYRASERYIREALEKRRRVLGNEAMDTLVSLNTLGSTLYDEKKLAEAEVCFRESATTSRRVFGMQEAVTLVATNDLAAVLYSQDKLSEAEPYAREAVEASRRALGMEHPDTLAAITTLAALLDEMGKLDEAEPYYREALAARRRTLGNDHPDTIHSVTLLAEYLDDRGRPGEAESLYREEVESKRRVLGKEHPDTVTSAWKFGQFLMNQKRLDEAEPYLREAFEASPRVLGQDNAQTLRAVLSMSGWLVNKGRHAEAERLLVPVVAAVRKAFAVSQPIQLAIFLKMLGQARSGQGKFAVAEPDLIEAEGIFDRTGTSDDIKAKRKCIQALVDLYQAWDKAEQGKGHAAQATDWAKRLETLDATGPKRPGT